MILVNGNSYEVDSSLDRRHIVLRYDPYDLSQIRVTYEGRPYPDALPVQLRRERHKGVEPAPPAPAPTGLNYLTLASQHHAEKVQTELGAMSYPRLVNSAGGDSDAH